MFVFFVCFVFQQTIRELFDFNEGGKREAAVELTVPPAEEEETGNKQSTTILEQVRALVTYCKKNFHEVMN